MRRTAKSPTGEQFYRKDLYTPDPRTGEPWAGAGNVANNLKWFQSLTGPPSLASRIMQRVALLFTFWPKFGAVLFGAVPCQLPDDEALVKTKPLLLQLVLQLAGEIAGVFKFRFAGFAPSEYLVEPMNVFPLLWRGGHRLGGRKGGRCQNQQDRSCQRFGYASTLSVPLDCAAVRSTAPKPHGL